MTNDLWQARPDHIPVLGHRGICAKYPDNTLISFEAAIELGVDLIEFDVNVTSDGELVIVHGPDIKHTSDHEGLTRSYTLEQLKSFDFGCPQKFGDKFKGTQIPTLREVLELANPHKNLLLNVEIKDYTPECVDKTVALLDEYGINDRCVLACFDGSIIRYIHKAYPKMRSQGFPARFMANVKGQEEETYKCMFGMGIPMSWGDSVEAIKADVKMAKERGILAWLFVADTEENVKLCVDCGCDNITGNDPEVALKVLRSMGMHE